MVVLVLEGTGVDDFVRWAEASDGDFRSTAKIFDSKLEFISPAAYETQIADDLAILPLTCGQAERLKQELGSLEAALDSKDYFE